MRANIADRPVTLSKSACTGTAAGTEGPINGCAPRGDSEDGKRLRFAGVAGLGVAGSVIGLAGVASAAEPLPSLFWTVDPPTLGETHSPNPVSGSTGVSTVKSLELATNNDFGSNNAPTGKVTFTDSLGIITGHCKNEAVTPQNLDASYAHCTVTFPTTTTGNDIVTASYAGDHKNGATTGTQTIAFGPPIVTPEVAWPALLPLSAIALGGGALFVSRRRMRKLTRQSS